MRSGVGNKFFVTSVLLLAVVCNGCQLQPPGAPKKDDPDRNPNEDQSAPGTPQGTPPAQTDDAVGIRLSPLKVSVTVKSPGSGLYSLAIVPTLEKSCTTGGCHAASETIDLRAFPFQAEGSWAMDDIIADIGPNPDPDEVQKRLVRVLIASMQSGYMPPSGHNPVSDQDSGHFQRWLEDGLAVEASPFSGTFRLKGLLASQIVCDVVVAMTANLLDTIIDRESCKTADRIEYSLEDSAGQLVAGRQLTFTEFTQLTTWNLSLGGN